MEHLTYFSDLTRSGHHQRQLKQEHMQPLSKEAEQKVQAVTDKIMIQTNE